MVRVGLAGVGFMGWIHYLAYQRSSSARLVAFASRDAGKRGGDWSGIRGNFGPPGEQIDVSGMRVYEQVDQLLADPEIDAIDICLPPHCHVDVAIAALQAGKHVFCEKPLALTPEAGRQILAQANASGKCVMVAQVLPYMGPYRYALEGVQQGRWGRPLGGHFKRLISPPDWIPDFYQMDRVGGPMIDLHVHDAHFIDLVFGRPSSVSAAGPAHGSTARLAQILYRFPDPSIGVTAACGVVEQPGRPFTHGFELHCQQATLQFELSVLSDRVESMPLKVLHQDGRVEWPELPEADEIAAFQQEIEDMARSVQTGKIEPRLDGQRASDAIAACHAVQRSVLSGGREVPID